MREMPKELRHEKQKTVVSHYNILRDRVKQGAFCATRLNYLSRRPQLVDVVYRQTFPSMAESCRGEVLCFPWGDDMGPYVGDCVGDPLFASEIVVLDELICSMIVGK